MKLDFIKIFEAIELINYVNKLPLEEIVTQWEKYHNVDISSTPRKSLFVDENNNNIITDDTLIKEWSYTGLNNIDLLKILK